MVLSTALGSPLAKSTASCFICLFSHSATPITKENLCLADELWERWYTGQRKRIRIPLGKFFNFNLTQTEMAHVGSLLGRKATPLHSINKVVRESFFGQEQIYLTSPPAYRLFQCQGAPNLLESLLRCRFPGLDAWVRLRRHLSDAPETYSLPTWISMMIYFYFHYF